MFHNNNKVKMTYKEQASEITKQIQLSLHELVSYDK
jgi:hypothetical protein